MSPRRRLTRKEIKKKDEFISTIDHIYNFFAPLVTKHKREIALAVVIIVVVIAGFIGWRYYRKDMEKRAQVMLFIPVKVYHLPVEGEAEKSRMRDDLPRFSSFPEKFQYVYDELQKVIDRYPGSNAAAEARYYQGLCYFKMGRFELAVKKFNECLDRRPPKRIYILSSYTLGETCEGLSKYDEAVSLYQRVLDKGGDVVPEDESLWRIASCYLKKGEEEKALPLLQRIVEKFPDSPHREEAEKETGYISPELTGS
jgi:tetratricopeptide (TPR) repeat protein